MLYVWLFFTDLIYRQLETFSLPRQRTWPRCSRTDPFSVTMDLLLWGSHRYLQLNLVDTDISVTVAASNNILFLWGSDLMNYLGSKKYLICSSIVMEIFFARFYSWSLTYSLKPFYYPWVLPVRLRKGCLGCSWKCCRHVTFFSCV